MTEVLSKTRSAASSDSPVRDAGLRSDGELVQADPEAGDGFVFVSETGEGAVEGGHRDDWCDLLSMGGGVMEEETRDTVTLIDATLSPVHADAMSPLPEGVSGDGLF